MFTWICREDETSEFQEFLDSLPAKDRGKLLSVITDTENFGIQIAIKMKWVSKIKGEKNLFELRSKCGSNIQRVLYFHEVDSNYVITHGFTKKKEKTPPNEIEHAIAMRKKYEEDNQNDSN